MPRVIYTLDDSVDEISGIKFSPLADGGVISEEVDQETADLFLSIPGYEPAKDDQEPAPPAPKSVVAPKKPAPKKEEPKKEEPKDPPAPDSGEGEGEVF